MDNFVVAVIIVSTLAMVVYMALADIRHIRRTTRRSRTALAVLLVSVLLMISDMAVGGDVCLRVMFDLNLALVSLMLLTCSLLEDCNVMPGVYILTGLSLLLSFYYFMCASGVLQLQFSSMTYILTSDFVAKIQGFVFLYAIWRRLSDIRTLMEINTVWTFVSVCVDIVYVICINAVPFFYLLSVNVSGDLSESLSSLFLLLLGAALLSLTVRLSQESLFVLMSRHERLIVESMRLNHISLPADLSGADCQYRQVYERITKYFDEQKPYLDGELSINAIADATYSNKVYISKAISHYTGKNFCQFVNYHRVKYAVELYRDNLDMRISELGLSSGFNSIVSFNMSFRLFMGENPSEWCRKERSRIVKQKK